MRIPGRMQEIQATLPLVIENVEDGENIYQRCLLIKGRSPSFEEYGDSLVVVVKDAFGDISPAQTWPMSQGYFKAMVLLSPGSNTVTLERQHNNKTKESATLNLSHAPLLQVPPLHLAIMIAKDSPLLIDCPYYKAGGLSSTHSDLNAAIAKFRTTAYMWQALTAEDMRAKGLGRRSFRLEEEFGLDTTNRASSRYRHDRSTQMGPVAKVHLVRSEKTVAKLLDPDVAQQNDKGRNRDALHQYFETALKAYGGVFQSSAKPVVAGLILDSAFSPEQNLLLGHAALGCHNPDGLSLGVFGSHLTYSWPRFFDEISTCLTDTTPPGDLVCNDNGECETVWEACSIGQGAFLHEVGHAFGAPHTTGIMARGYAQHWPKNFIAETAYCAKTKTDGVTVVDGTTRNDACWDLRDALSFRCLPHFRLPGDALVTLEMRQSIPSITPDLSESGCNDKILVKCKAGIARIIVSNNKGPEVLEYGPSTDIFLEHFSISCKDYDRSKPLSIEVIGNNGRVEKVTNAWKPASRTHFFRIPDSDIILRKQSAVRTGSGDEDDEDDEDDENGEDDAMDESDDETYPWAVLLKEKGPDGELSQATKIDLRVGCILDGAVVYFADGHSTPCGPRFDPEGNVHEFGGHASEELDLPHDAEIEKVEVRVGEGWGDDVLGGIRMTLSNGTIKGELNVDGSDDGVSVLEPGNGERIVGFFGRSKRWEGYTTEFGILVAPKGIELPSQAYDLVELQNIHWMKC